MKSQAAKASNGKKSSKKLSSEEREHLVIEFLPRIRYMAGRLAIKLPPSIEVDDLMSCGITGLLDAIDKFDPGKNVKFSTYAEFRIRGAMLDYLREIDWCPRSLRQKANNLQTVMSDLEAVLGRPPEEHEVASELGISVDELHKELSQIAGVSVFSLDEIGEDDQTLYPQRKLLGEYLADQQENREFLHDLREVLAKAITELPENEKLLISLYYYDEMTMKEIGTILNLTESRICQIHNQAVLRLRGKVKSVLMN